MLDQINSLRLALYITQAAMAILIVLAVIQIIILRTIP